MKAWGNVFLSVCLVLSISVTGGAVAKNDVDSAVSSDEGELIRILIKEESTIKERINLKSKYGVRRNFGQKGYTTDVTPEEFEKLQEVKGIKVSRVDKVYASVIESSTKKEVSALAAPSTRVPWGVKAIYNNQALEHPSGGSGVVVAVLDTGVLTTHEDLKANIGQCKDFSQNRSPIVDNSCQDKNGHGTHVAGTIAANGGSGSGIYGVAPEATIWAYKVLGTSGSGSSDDIANAIQHAADQGKSLGKKVIISMSLGSSAKNSLISDAVDYAVSQGALVVAAAGNSGPDPNTIEYPGALANVVAVAALENTQENGTYRVADFSSRGNSSTAGDYVIQERDVEVSAPGHAIESTWKNGGYNTISGTSMATPHIAGLAAKIWASNKNLTNAQLRSELQDRAKNNDMKGGTHASSGDDIAAGFGFPLVKSTD